MKRHYEIMRVMRTKVVNFRDLFEGLEGVVYVYRAVLRRAKDLTGVSISSRSDPCRIDLITPISDNFSQQRLDPEKQFQSFAFGIVRSFLSSERSSPPFNLRLSYATVQICP